MRAGNNNAAETTPLDGGLSDWARDSQAAAKQGIAPF